MTNFTHPFCPYFTENFHRFMHNFERRFCHRFSQKPLQLKGYFKVAQAIFSLSLRQNFSLAKPSLTPQRLRSHSSRRSAPRLRICLLSYAPASNAATSSSAVPAHKSCICIKTSREDTRGKHRRARRQIFAARKMQSRLTIRLDDTTECGTSQKMHIFQNSNRRLPRRQTHRHALRSSNTDAFKMPPNRLADTIVSIQISLKAKRSV